MWKPGQLITLKNEVYRVVCIDRCTRGSLKVPHFYSIVFENKEYSYEKHKDLHKLPFNCVLVQQVFSKSS